VVGPAGPRGHAGQCGQALNTAVNQILSKPAVRDHFLREGAETRPMTPAQFAAVVAGDVERWKKLARQQNIVAE